MMITLSVAEDISYSDANGFHKTCIGHHLTCPYQPFSDLGLIFLCMKLVLIQLVNKLMHYEYISLHWYKEIHRNFTIICF